MNVGLLTLSALIVARFFDAVGGIPAANRTDRMGALGRSQGRRFVLRVPRGGAT